MDYLKSTLSRAILGKDIPAFPYNIGTKVDSYDGVSIWELRSGTKKEDDSPVSIFTFDCARNRDRLSLAKNAFRKMRTIRHPDLLKYVDGVETDDYIYVVTDPVVPLQTRLTESIDNNLKLWGLYKIANVLKFLNEDCQIIHGNVRIASIFTNKAGEWKLGGFELMSSIKEESPIIHTYGGLMPEAKKYASPEIIKGSWNVLKDFDVHVIDTWDYGLLIYEVYNGQFSTADQLSNRGSIPSNLARQYKQLISQNARSRPNMSSFIEQGLNDEGFFQDDFIQTALFLEHMSIKDAREKEAFIKKLNSSLDNIHRDFCKYKILPELIHSVEYGSGGAKVLDPIIKIGSFLSEEEYETTIVALIVKLFAMPDRTIRLSLLENFSIFIDHLSEKVINDKIFSHMATGFTDTAPIIRESTVKSVLLLAPKLSDRILNNDLLRYLAKLQTDDEPGIRTNTTICLGKISKYFSESTKKKVLVLAFTRALKDPFPHARVASLMALAATLQYYDASECATKIVPCVSTALIDKEKQVRTQAFKTLDMFVKRLEKLTESMPDSATPPQQSNGTGAGGVAVVAGAVATVAESWGGWAVTSLTKKLAGEGDLAPDRSSNNQSPSNDSSLGIRSGKNDTSPATSTSSLRLSFADNASGDASDGWGGDESIEAGGKKDESQSSVGMKLGVSAAASPMKLVGTSRIAYQTDGWDVDDSGWGNGEDGWDNDWTTKPSSQNSSSSSQSMSTNATKEERVAEMHQRREERRQRMAELREKKKKSGGLGARRV
ncbi:926_t:CDS:10 [Paraglomus occultum]|uniref:926_t:CDS:1 n=1 Tax=Paraglomus occultum TaxID=144539 RepID=A0A9N8ZP24_9GLOM|nr:926_t:CDS:10 [Paraglomus occultum]